VNASTLRKPKGHSLDAGDLYAAHAQYVASLGYRMLGRDDLVDDLVQDVFVLAIRRLDDILEPEAVRAWLAKVTVRLAGRRLKRRRLAVFLGLEDEVVPDEALVSSQASPEDRVLLGQVYRVLEAVPVDDRLAWTLRYVEGMRLEEVAEACGCSLATAKRRIARAGERVERSVHAE
jgi:RNA polymerase sigma-70 factor, ECF subfamily